MGNVIKVDGEKYTIMDIDDVLEIVYDKCGSDVYEYIKQYIVDIEVELAEMQMEYNELEKFINNYAPADMDN